MKILLSNPDNTLGFALPTDEPVSEIGLYDPELIYAQLAALESFKALEPDKIGVGVIRVAFIEAKNGSKHLAMRPKDAKGEAWIILAPRVEVD